MTNMDELIQSTIAAKAKLFETDKYGQVLISNFQPECLFPDYAVCDKVVAFLESKQSEVYVLSTYAGKFGQYKAIRKKF